MFSHKNASVQLKGHASSEGNSVFLICSPLHALVPVTLLTRTPESANPFDRRRPENILLYRAVTVGVVGTMGFFFPVEQQLELKHVFNVGTFFFSPRIGTIRVFINGYFHC